MNSLLRTFAIASLISGAAVFGQSAASSASVASQTQSSVSSRAASASGGAAAATDTQSSVPAGHAASTASMTSVPTELTSKVDSRNAAIGQEVTAKTRESARLADGTTLPKGTKLVGHVTQVQSHGKNQAGSMLAMTFDRAELRNGHSIPLHCVMQSIAPPATEASLSGDDSMMAGADAGPVGAGASVSGGGRGGLGVGGGGGLLGGTGGAVHSTAAAGSALTAAGHTAGSALNTAGRTTVGAASQTGGALPSAAHASAIPGVMLSNSASSDASGTLTAGSRNISLDSGTQMTLGLAAQ